MGRILAIDYGTKRTGLAVTDPECLIAGPLDSVPTHKLMDYLREYCRQEIVDCIVVGEPKRWNGTDTQSSQPIRQFITVLEKVFPGIRVARADERFTSLLASRAILEAGISRSGRRDKALVDRVSAVIILQGYMDSLIQST
ncbi:MAG TPA: Holliday junction resolvase RuvX [Bacteroidales bacterium]|nr:Holliday junction resolvase RuvX [Bacteroidales bacterium]HSA43801.1 Holliday junction resolvase RuvX [Bacteroidales bacterium]